MKVKDVGALFLLAALWGASFLFIRVASPVLGPLLTIELRVSLAGIVLLLYAWSIKAELNLRAYWKQYLMIGALNAAIPFTLIAMAALHLNASITSILNSLTPLFTALVAWAWLKERLTMNKWLGIVLGCAGIVILVGWSPLRLTSTVVLSTLLSILATVSYSFAGVYAKKAFKDVSSLSVATGQQLGASLLLLPFTVFNLPSAFTISTPVIISVLGLALLCTALAYLLYFYLIASVGPTKTLSVTFLIPLFGTVWGIMFLQEVITAGMVVGLFTILFSVFLISDLKPAHVLRQVQNRRSM
jgi:drug/metabolite transporter (DMT)-like permease